MKFTIPALLCAVLFCCVSCKNKNAGSSDDQNQDTILVAEQKSLIALGQLWGFLKYHHPAVAAGKYDWDKELIDRIPAVMEAGEEEEWKKILSDWVKSMPAIPETDAKKLPGLDIKVRPDYGELFNPDYFNTETIEALKHILDNAGISSNHYIEIDRGGTVKIQNERAYEDMRYPDLPYRLLALYRYWNIVNYFFPYREICDREWSSTLKELLPEFITAENQQQYIRASLKLGASTDDSHVIFHSSGYEMLKGISKVPFETRFIEDKLVVTSYTGDYDNVRDKVRRGDIITKINGQSVENIVDSLLTYTPASNYAVKQRGISRDILRENRPAVDLSVSRNEREFDIQVPRFRLDSLNIPNYSNTQPGEEGYKIIEGNIGYIYPANCKAGDRNPGIARMFSGTKGVIVDLRCYPDDYICYTILGYLVSEPLKVKETAHGNVAYPGYFFLQSAEKVPHPNLIDKNTYKNKVVVIVNEQTQSQAEDHAVTLQAAPNVTVIGSTTAGANGSTFYFDLPGGIKTRITGKGVYYPDGSDLQRNGVRIDETVKPTIAGIKEGRDEVLERALEIVGR